MAEFVLTTSSTILCGTAPHGGTVSKGSTARLTVNAARVIPNAVQPPLPGEPNGLGTVSSCPNQPPPASKVPCKAVKSIAQTTVSTRLTVSGSAVLLATLQGLTDGVAPGTLSATAGQAKLKAS